MSDHRVGYILHIPAEGVQMKLWRYAGCMHLLWEWRYILQDLGIRLSAERWLRRNAHRVQEHFERFGLDKELVLRSNRSRSAQGDAYFDNNKSNKELQMPTPAVLAMYASVATDPAPYGSLCRAMCLKRLAYYAGAATSVEVAIQIPWAAAGGWEVAEVRVQHGRFLDFGRLAQQIPDVALLETHDVTHVVCAMARRTNPLMTAQAPSILAQLSEIVDTHIETHIQGSYADSSFLLRAILGPSGKRVRRIDSWTELQIAQCKNGSRLAIASQLGDALGISERTGAKIDIVAVAAYTNKCRLAFENVRRLHISVDGACYARVEMLTGVVYAPSVRVGAYLHQMVPCRTWPPTHTAQ